MDKTLYTARQMAAILRCHPQTVYRMADRGELDSIKVGNLRRFLMPREGQNNDSRKQSDGGVPTKGNDPHGASEEV